MRRMEIGPNRPMSIIFLHQKYVHDPKVWPIMNTAVTNDIKILANTLLTQIEPPNRDCFGRGSLRLSVVSAKFWGELIRPILMGRFGHQLFRPWVLSARGGGTLIFSAYVSLDPASTVYPIKISEQQAFPNKYVIES